MSDHWAGKTVVVTGGSSGLGLAIARAFAVRGAHAILIARNEQRLRQAVVALQQRNLAATAIAADITHSEEVAAAFGKIRQIRPTLDALVNSAGQSSRAAILDTTPDDFQASWDLNFLGLVRCTREAAADLLAARGHLVNIGSLAGKTASRYLGAYPATKFAVSAYTQQLRLELGPDGLHVMLVCPGPIRRDDQGHRYDDEAKGLPETARRPGGGAKLKLIDPDWLAHRIVRGCRQRAPEIVVPGAARWLFAVSQLWPRCGDWILSRKT